MCPSSPWNTWSRWSQGDLPVGSPGKTGTQGTCGTCGKKGAKEEPGIQGSTGQKGERGDKGDNAFKFLHMFFRTVTVKKYPDTSLHVYYAGNLRIALCDKCCSRRYFTFNGAECSSPGTIDSTFYLLMG
ncbi:unnamed protein product [Porites evermanni]|uniref:CTHRC1 C-terminal domain-containing protein n=1 Tax=Porites evermanni TaxID=104178 RepID=A0ABN8RZM8_9CNID|nr:unnamed protein product [Porites evermanni]